MIRIAVGYALLGVGLLALLATIGPLYRIGLLGTMFGFMVVVPLLTLVVYNPAAKLISEGRKQQAARAAASSGPRDGRA